MTVICKVLDENDCSPKFLFPVSEIHIPENQQPSVVYVAEAVDMDAGNNGALRYHIIGKLYPIIFISVNQEACKQQYLGCRLPPALSTSFFYVEREKKSFTPLSALISPFQAHLQSVFWI